MSPPLLISLSEGEIIITIIVGLAVLIKTLPDTYKAIKLGWIWFKRTISLREEWEEMKNLKKLSHKHEEP